eukprot:362057-Chlamydomonas_euryale.AAC.16
MRTRGVDKLNKRRRGWDKQQPELTLFSTERCLDMRTATTSSKMCLRWPGLAGPSARQRSGQKGPAGRQKVPLPSWEMQELCARPDRCRKTSQRHCGAVPSTGTGRPPHPLRDKVGTIFPTFLPRGLGRYLPCLATLGPSRPLPPHRRPTVAARAAEPPALASRRLKFSARCLGEAPVGRHETAAVLSPAGKLGGPALQATEFPAVLAPALPFAAAPWR